MARVQSDKAVISRAIRSLKNPTGSSFADIKKYLQSKCPDRDITDSKNLKVYLKDAEKRGEILKADGKYQVKEAAKRVQAEASRPNTRQSKKESESGKTAEPKDTKVARVQSDKAVISRAIRSVKNSTGTSFADIEKYLQSKCPDRDIAVSKNLKKYLIDAEKRGDISKADGKYQIKEAAKRVPAKSTKSTPVKEKVKDQETSQPKVAKNPKGTKKELPENENQTADGDGQE